ncbi:hypothetical protein VTN77DRAFT_466 [Rasamsonia byssochlamydoides]|uniref:uncharacterized protein n=1 Tax=Rasamsonia byssochlamydoides TaxID=89139 RepID=UPI0037435A5B
MTEMAPRTIARYQTDASLRELVTRVISCQPLSTLAENERALFKTAPDDDYVVATSETIFHPQGGGQPSDTGTMKSDNNKEITFEVKMARKLSNGQILHAGSFISQADDKQIFSEGETVVQAVDNDKRDYHSRLHTAGHLIGLAVRQLADSIPNVSELKANHAPGSSFVEFQGLIGGEHKDAIQQKVTDMVMQSLPVNVCWWDERKVRECCTGVPDAVTVPDDGLMRVVEVQGVGAYPCGGTHLPTTYDIGEVVVRKISRQKGISKISYEVKERQ